ncbi:MAG: minor capsid protein [Halanaerobiales bacterium]|nr:minor capsid protein [Halanaerobiales bacterium]
MIIRKIENRLNEEVYVQKYLKMLHGTIDRIDKGVMQIFARVNKAGKWSNKEMAKYNRNLILREQIRDEIKKYKTSFVSGMRNDLEKLYKGESLFTQKLLKTELNIKKSFTHLPVQAVKTQVVDAIKIKGKTMADYISKYSTDLVFRIEQEIFDSIALGENPRKTTRRLKDIYSTMAKHRVDMTTRSWTNAIYNQSNLDVYEQAELKKVRYLATLDAVTCPICAADHNKIYILGKQPFLPRHPNCRCAYSPYIDEELTGPANSYENWLIESSISDEELERILKRINNYTERGLILSGEGRHLEKIIENIILMRMGIIDPVRNEKIKKIFGQLLPDVDDQTLYGLADAHKAVGERGRVTGNEFAVTIEKGTGKKTYSLTSNKADQVEFTEDFQNYLQNQKRDSIIAVHNHPCSSSFSSTDLGVMCSYNSIYAITVEGHNGVKYMCRIGSGHRPTPGIIEYNYNLFEKLILGKYLNKVHQGKLTIDEAGFKLFHEVMTEVAKMFNWEYRRVLP